MTELWIVGSKSQREIGRDTDKQIKSRDMYKLTDRKKRVRDRARDM